MRARRIVETAAAAAIIAMLLNGCIAGCAQNVEPVQTTDQNQKTVTPTRQASATPTTIEIHVNPINGPSSDPVAMSGNTKKTPSTKPAQERKIMADASKGKATCDGEDARYVQIVNVWVDTSASGSTGGTATGTTTSSQSQSAAQTVTSEQKPEAAIQLQIPIGIGAAPRITVDGTQAYKGDAASGTHTVDQSGEQFLATLKSAGDTASQQLAQVIQAYLAKKTTTTATTAPAE